MWSRRVFLAAVGSTALALAVTDRADAASSSFLSSTPGVDRTGMVDSSAAVQRFVTANAGGTIFVDGIFRMDAPLMLPSNTTLSGVGTSSGFRFTWADPAQGGAYIGNVDPIAGNANIRITDLTVIGAGTGLPAGSAAGAIALSFRRGTGLTIMRVTVENSPSIGIAYQGYSTVRITDNVVTGAGRDGISGWWYTAPMTDVVVARNRIIRPGDDGIAVNASAPENPNRVQRPTNIQILDNVIEGHSTTVPNLWGRGIVLLGVDTALVQGNSVTNSAAAGVLIAPDENPQSAGFRCTNVRVQRNTITSAGRQSALTNQPRPGIFATGTDNLFLWNNTVSDSLEDGMVLSGLTATTVSGNTVTASGSSNVHAGISVAGAETGAFGNVTVNGNTVSGNASGGIRMRNLQQAVVQSNHVSNNGTLGDSHSPLSAGIWVYDCPSGYLARNVMTQSETPVGVGRHSWGSIASCLATEDPQTRYSNTSTGAVVGALYCGLGWQANINIWQI